MTFNFDLITLLVGIVFSILLPIVTCFSRKRIYARWARIASITACIAGLGWGILGLVLLHLTVSVSESIRLEGINGMLGGICIGLAISIMIAKPYEKRVA
jgi:hypothetical protein